MRVKEAPASALRAMFGGIGTLLGVSDKARAKSAAPEATATTETAPPETTTPATETPAVTVVDVVVEVPEVAEPAVVAPEAVVAESVAVETVVVEPVVAEGTGALPLANYDDLSIASLRARLRNLSADQLGTLLEYEKSHAARADVISMFERRIVKLAEA